MNKKMLVFFMILFLILAGAGCNQQSNSETTIEGVVTAVNEEKSFIYIDGHPIVVDNVSAYTVGQQAKAELIDTSVQDAWNPMDMVVKELEVSSKK